MMHHLNRIMDDGCDASPRHNSSQEYITRTITDSPTTPNKTRRNEQCNQSSWLAFPFLTHKDIDQVGKVPSQWIAK
jgi:hypothetical protein